MAGNVLASRGAGHLRKDCALWRQSLFLLYFISCIGTRESAGFIAARRTLETNQIRNDGVRDAPKLGTAITPYKAPLTRTGRDASRVIYAGKH
jgi:hypothetical protein